VMIDGQGVLAGSGHLPTVNDALVAKRKLV
jgi:hypothetical protein